ncbi:MAG: FtsH protease activity modulator HflK [Candidatus Cloacimonetes bacterium]|nr:FtsH protease activity modulator HflK [Candidatus Cloacimonadota bacterium]
MEGNVARFKMSRKKAVTILIVAVLGIFLLTGFYVVNPEEEAVVQRFGAYVRTAGPGLHFKIPFGIETKTVIKVKKVQKTEFGFRTLQAGVQTQYSSADYSGESLMLTGDLNIADVEWIVQYRIKDPVAFLFNVRNALETMRDVSESVTRQVVGDRSIDEVLTLSRKEIAFLVEGQMQETLDAYESGIEIVAVNLQNVKPPAPVQPAFNAVNSAMQERDRIKNEAEQQYNQVIPEATGRAERSIQEALGYRVARINRAEGEVAMFRQVLTEYRKAPQVTRRRLYLETMREVLTKVDKIYLVDEDLESVLPLLNLDRGGQ